MMSSPPTEYLRENGWKSEVTAANEQRQLRRQGFLMYRDKEFSTKLFCNVLELPALACGLHGILAKLKGTDKWCLTVEGNGKSIRRFKEYLLLGQAAFGRIIRQSAEIPITIKRIQGFNVLPKDVVVDMPKMPVLVHRCQEEDEYGKKKRKLSDEFQ